MEFVSCKWIPLALVLSFLLLFSRASSAEIPPNVRAANLGGWLVLEGWIKPSLFDGIPNGDMLDGKQVQLRSLIANNFVSAANGGGSVVTVDRKAPSTWETFRLWRVSESEFQFRTFVGGQFLSSDGAGGLVSATANSPSSTETFIIERHLETFPTKVHIKLQSTGAYLQVSPQNELRADYKGTPGWDNSAVTFVMQSVADMRGDYQLGVQFGPAKAKQVLTEHRETFVTAEDFQFLSSHGINTVRIPVAWWTASESDPELPYVGGSLGYLDKAFKWAEENQMKCIIDLHAAPGNQNGQEHGGGRDGTLEWTNPENIEKSLSTIDFFAERYANHPALLGIELLNEPWAAFPQKEVPIDTLVEYYRRGYDIVRSHTQTAYVIICQRIGADPMELFKDSNRIGSSRLVVDIHYYSLFNDAVFKSWSAETNYQFIYNERHHEIQKFNAANGPLLFIGEWTNEWELKDGSMMDYQNFGRAQLEVYGRASFGWAYWTLKNNQQHWDLKWNINNNILQIK